MLTTTSLQSGTAKVLEPHCHIRACLLLSWLAQLSQDGQIGKAKANALNGKPLRLPLDKLAQVNTILQLIARSFCCPSFRQQLKYTFLPSIMSKYQFQVPSILKENG